MPVYIKHRKRWIRYLFLMVAVIIAIKITMISWLFIDPELKTRTQFTALTSPLNHTYDLFDLGVVDVNSDRYLDIFTLNHSARQDFLLGNQNGTYEDGLSAWNLDQDHQFSGLEDRDLTPKIDRPGLYIYRHNFLLHLYAHRLNSQISGKLTLSLPVTIQEQEKAFVSIEETPLPSGGVTTEVNFSLQNEAHVIIEDFPEIPHVFEVNSNTPLSSINLGMDKLQPQQHRFTLMWRDRHSMAWADVNGDGRKDVFIGRGGVRGKISQIPEILSDELFVQTEAGFEEQIDQFNLIKNGCPARKSAWVDYDGDGLLDLYLSCGRSGVDTIYPNQLYHQRSNNQFVNVAEEFGLNLPDTGYFQWLDIDADGDQDLIASEGEQTVIYLNQTDGFEPRSIEGSSGGTLVKLAIADFDSDGDFDGYGVIEGGKNQMLINQDGMLTFQAAADSGLPEEGLDANWIDYDNDGDLELYVVPNGLYQREKAKFKATRLLDFRRPLFSIWNARSVWFDADQDGDRDLLLAYQQTPSILQPKPSIGERLKNQVFKRDTTRIWQSILYQNRGSTNHWLQVNLVGSKGNSEAIGAVISVETDRGRQMQQIGATEESRYSQGNYRAYFGVGENSQIKKVVVQWTDGTQQELIGVPADQLLTVAKSNA